MNGGSQLIENARYNGTDLIGVGYANVTGSLTDVDVVFGRYRTGTTDAWSGVSSVYWKIVKVSGGAQVGYPISPNNLVKSLVRYNTAAGQSMANGAQTIVDFGTKVFDTKGEVTTGASWKFTAAQTGYYRVDCNLLFTATTTWSESEVVELSIFKNAVQYSCIGRQNGRDFSALTEYMPVSGGDIIYLVAGDYIDLRGNQGSGGTLALLNNNIFNFVSIEQIG
jgi:hypothetical protein